MTEIKLYKPSNGTEGACFYAGWCENCAKDKTMSEGKDFDECEENEICSIIADTLAYDVDEPQYPQEWRYDESGEPCCTAFIPVGQNAVERCDKTIDMFSEAV